MKEKEIERRLCGLIKKHGGLTYKFTSPNAPGVPDRIIITPAGVVWFVELKTDTGRLSKIQGHRIGELQQRKANVRVVHGYEDTVKFIEEVFQVESS
jgi:hypothetical protein